MKNILLVLLSAASFSTYAGCGESNTVCHHYKSGKLISKNKCEVTTCSNMTNPYQSYWKWKNNKVEITSANGSLKLNGKSAYMLPTDLIAKPACFAVVGTKEIFCAEDNL